MNFCNRAFSLKKINFVSEFLISQDENFCQIATLLILSQIINLKFSANFSNSFLKSRKMTKRHENITF